MSGKKKKKRQGPAPVPEAPTQAEAAPAASRELNLSEHGRQSTVLASALLKPVAGTPGETGATIPQSVSDQTQQVAQPEQDRRRRMLRGFSGGSVFGRY